MSHAPAGRVGQSREGLLDGAIRGRGCARFGGATGSSTDRARTGPVVPPLGGVGSPYPECLAVRGQCQIPKLI